jgi:hypothetical protein
LVCFIAWWRRRNSSAIIDENTFAFWQVGVVVLEATEVETCISSFITYSLVNSVVVIFFPAAVICGAVPADLIDGANLFRFIRTD